MAAKVRERISSLPHGEPTKCEGQIRKLHKKIQSLENEEEKEALLDELGAVACCGLSIELKELLERKGLSEESGLHLVVNHITNLPELAYHLYRNEDEDGQFKVIRKRLGQDLELLVALKAEGVNIENQWANDLCKKAPSLRSLRLLSNDTIKEICNDATKKELDIISKLRHESSYVPCNPKQAKMVATKKAEDKKKLEEEVKSIATSRSGQCKNEVNDKSLKVSERLEIPTDWYEQNAVPPEELTKNIEEIMQQKTDVAQSYESYDSDREIILKASGGLALRGVYYSKYEPMKPAGQPLLSEPADIQTFNPSLTIDISYKTFTQEGAAAKYVKAVADSGTDSGLCIRGLCIGDIEGAGGYHSENNSSRTAKSSSTTASVLRSTSIAKKEFQISREKMSLSTPAKECALSIEEYENKQEAACLFMKQYGSHFPGGPHKLGGISYSIADARCESSVNTSTLTEMTVKRLETRMSGGLGGLDVGGVKVGALAGAADNSSFRGSAEETRCEDKKVTYKFSEKVIGPQSTNLETFEQLLANNSTWAIIDRGPPDSYIPVWQLLREQGSEFNTAAENIEMIWKEDEAKLQNRAEEQKRQQKRIEWGPRQKLAEDDLRKEKEYLVDCTDILGKSSQPINGRKESRVVFMGTMRRKNAYDRALEFVMKDFEHNICHLSLYKDEESKEDCCLLECYIAPSDSPMKFEETVGDHVLFFSKVLFKWKDKVPIRTEVNKDNWSLFYNFVASSSSFLPCTIL